MFHRQRFHLTLVWHTVLRFYPTQGIEFLEGALHKSPFEIVTTEPFLFNLCKSLPHTTCPSFPSGWLLHFIRTHSSARCSASVPIACLDFSPRLLSFFSAAEKFRKLTIFPRLNPRSFFGVPGNLRVCLSNYNTRPSPHFSSALDRFDPGIWRAATLYELRASYGMELKKDLLIQVAQMSGDGLRTTCLKMPTN